MAQAGNRAGKTQPCMQMGEHEFEWVPVTSGSMNVCNSALLLFVWLLFYGGTPVCARLAWKLGQLCHSSKRAGLLDLEVVKFGFPSGIIR